MSKSKIMKPGMRGVIVRVLSFPGGFLALAWFLIRVIPKPSRALYPCQRAAFPLASAFVAALLGLGMTRGVRQLARPQLANSRPARSRGLVSVLLIAACLPFFLFGSAAPVSMDFASPASAPAALVRGPIGEPRGIRPGRVAWAFDPGATPWKGIGNGHWWEPQSTNQSVVDTMLAQVVCSVAGASGAQSSNVAASWDALLKFYNASEGRGSRGYQKGERFMIKVNFVGAIAVWGALGPDAIDYPNTSPHVIHALLDQLVNRAGVTQSDITVGDTLCNFPDGYYNLLARDFPRVNYLSYTPQSGRVTPRPSSVRMFWSTPNADGTRPDYLPTCFAEAAYLVNLANLKGHFDQAGITLCGKNNYGSLYRRPDGPGGFFNLHADSPRNNPRAGSYRNMVDLMAHDGLGGKTVLYLIDGLYAARHSARVESGRPLRWKSAPFNGGWTSSLFASQDPVAIDSVGMDFLLAEWPIVDPGESISPASPGVEDYLVEAALVSAPPSGVFYHPTDASPVKRPSSLGVHEHWKDAVSRRYSGNDGKKGIELVQLGGSP